MRNLPRGCSSGGALRAAAMATVFALGCAGGAEQQPPPQQAKNAKKPQPKRVRAQKRFNGKVGPAGATISLANGAKLRIPPKALGQTRSILFGVAPESRGLRNRAGVSLVGPMLQIQPGFVTSPGKKVVVSVPLKRVPSGYEKKDLAFAIEQRAEEQRAMQMGGVRTVWRYHKAFLRGGRLRGKLRRVHGMRVRFVATR